MDQDDGRYTQLAKYLANELDPAERAAVETWLATDANHQALLDDLKQVWEASPAATWDVEAAHQQVWTRIRRHESPTTTFPNRRLQRLAVPHRAHQRQSIHRILGGSLVLGLLILAAVLWTRRPLPEATPPAWKVVQADAGQHLRLQLTDGSSVVLNAGSMLHYPERFEASVRQVRLSGEAFFEVTSGQAWPFEVRTAHGWTRVLGTRFLVSLYPEQEAMTVAVEEGRVAVTTDTLEAFSTNGHHVQAGEVARLTGDTVHVTALENTAVYFGWLDKQLAFDDTPLALAAARLSRWYGLEVEVAPALRDRRITVTFTRESADEALHILARTLDARVEHEGSRVRIAPLQ